MNGIRAGRLGQDRGGSAGGDWRARRRSTTSRTRSSGRVARCCGTAGSTGPGATTTRSSSCASGCSRSSAAAPATSRGCTSTTRRARPCWRWSRRRSGVFNIVDDEPAPASEWLPYLADVRGAKPPRRVPAWLARLLAGEWRSAMMTEGARLLQRQGQARARLGAALSVVAAGLQGGAGVNAGAEEFEELRPLLFSIAYRILGSVSEAEDAVQETWLRYEALTDPAHLDQGVPVGRGDPDLDRRAALGARPAGGVRRAVVPRAAAHRPATRTRSARRSWPTRCRWRPCCCSSG